jgi:5-oxoprolinase (ATP-hydrolysing)
MRRRYRIGMDIGGTFTDFVLLDTLAGAISLHKRLTTPANPEEGALAGMRELLGREGIAMRDVDAILHGTTLVTNAIIERRGRPTALLTTRGFRDILEMGHEQRYDIYDLFLKYPEPIVPRRYRLEVDERVTRDGDAIRRPTLEEVLERVAALVAEGIEAVAICFLHSYLNPAHERLVTDALRQHFPDLYVSASYEVVPEIREYERTSTTVCNAYVQPIMDRYLQRIERALEEAGFEGRFSLMLSSGGTASPDTARRFPIRLLESGPAGGALATAYLGRRVGLPDLLAFDMGGTTAKACLIQNGRPDVTAEMEAGRIHRFKRGSGLPIRAPVVDMIEIGAGGGSIAHRDSLGLLKVGPQSAAADPGPASYGKGGTAPTVTDACLLLGYYDPAFFLGGAMPLEANAAQAAFARLAAELGLDLVRTAWGVHQVVCENMARAARVHIIEKGKDPRAFPILAFGGAGPAHAARVARILGATEVVVPPVSGVVSALGLLVAPTSFEFVQSLPGVIDECKWDAVNRMFDKFEREADRLLTASGVARDEIRYERSADARLLGQFHEIEIPVPAGELSAGTASILKETFAEVYSARYHTVLEGYRPMVMNWRLRAHGPEPDVTFSPASTRDVAQAKKGTRRAYFPEANGFTETPIYDRYALKPNLSVTGPAIVEERESTTVIAPGDRLYADESGNLRIEIGVTALSARAAEVKR